MSEPLQQVAKVTGMHCCACEKESALLGTSQQKAELEGQAFADILNVAGQALTHEWRPGDPKEARDAADLLLKQVFDICRVSLGARGLVIPDSWTLGGKSRG